MDCYFIKFSHLYTTYTKDIEIKFMLSTVLRNPFSLGKITRLSEVNDWTFAVSKVSTENHTYEFLENGLIKITQKMTNESWITEDKYTFKTGPFTKYDYPRVGVSAVRELFGFVENEKVVKKFFNRRDIDFMVLYGPDGCGKELFLSNLEQEMPEKHFISFSYSNLVKDKSLINSTMYVIEICRTDIVICVPEADKLDKTIAVKIYKLLRDVLRRHKRLKSVDLKVILTCVDTRQLFDPLRALVTKKVHISSLDPTERGRFLLHLVHQKRCNEVPKEDHSALISLADSLHGYTASDMVSFVNTVFRKDRQLTLAQLQDAKRNNLYRPQHLTDFVADIESLRWPEIGGYDEVKRLLRDEISQPLLCGRRVARGVLLHGPPGCSKTMFARALATECDLNMFVVRPSSVLCSFLGESEGKLRTILAHATASAPSIVFIDEIDTLLPKRRESSAGEVSGRLLAELLRFLNGAQSVQDDKVILMAATNRLDNIDEALLRPGRIDLVIEVGLPDECARQSILSINLTTGHCTVDPEVLPLIPRLALALAGSSGAAVASVAKKIQAVAQRRTFQCGDADDGSIHVIVADVREAVATLNVGFDLAIDCNALDIDIQALNID